MVMRAIWLCLTMLLAWSASARAAEILPIFDTHVHYSRAAWEGAPPAAIARALADAGVLRALVSSSPDDGSLRLGSFEPSRFVAVLRPYRGQIGAHNWARDEATIAYLAARLKRHRHAGIGEFHLNQASDARTPVLRAVARLALAYDIPVHVHTNSGPLEALLAVTPGLRVLWAHAGMVAPPEEIRRVLEAHGNVVAELSFRAGDILAGDGLDPVWRALLVDHANRFMIGSDTYINPRWAEYQDIIAGHRRWLGHLPAPAAAAIAYRNATRLFGDGGLAALRR